MRGVINKGTVDRGSAFCRSPLVPIKLSGDHDKENGYSVGWQDEIIMVRGSGIALRLFKSHAE